MADKKISDFTAASAVVAGDLMEIEDASGNSRKAPVSMISPIALISTQTPTGTGTVTFSSIPGTYRILKLVWVARSAVVAVSDNLNIRFNGDTGANYDRQFVGGSAAVAAAGESLAQTAALIGNISGSTATAGVIGSGFAEFPAYADTTFQKSGSSVYTYKSGNATGNVFARSIAMHWRSTAAITQIEVIVAGGNYEAGSVVSLYGSM